jgi:predicted ester cyclase
MEKETVKQTALAVSKAILEGRWNDLDNLLDENFTYTGDGFVFTKDEYIGFMQDMKAAFSNLQMQFPHILVDGDMASIRFISTAVNTGKFMGAPANKKNLEVHGIFIRKIKNGKVLQEWQTTDLLGVMRQIGFGALFGYALFVGLFKVKQERPVRKR